MMFPFEETFTNTPSHKLPSFPQLLEIEENNDIGVIDPKGKMLKVYEAVMITPKIVQMLEKFKVLDPGNVLVELIKLI